MGSMKVIGFVLVALVALDYIGESEAWVRVSIRVSVRIGRKRRQLMCQELFGLTCRTAELVGFLPYGTGCKVYPTADCHTGKRNLAPTTAEGFSYVPLPPKFENYDKDSNQKITLEEFTSPIIDHYQIENPAALKEMFEAADVDGNGVLEPSEFSVAPYIQADLKNNGLSIADGGNLVAERNENELKQTLENELLAPAIEDN